MCRSVLFLLFFYGIQAALVATPNIAYYRANTTISLGLFITPSELPVLSCTIVDSPGMGNPAPVSLNLSTSGELLCSAPPGRNGSQILQLDLSGLGRGLQSTLITYYDDFAMSLAPGSPALYRSTGGNNLLLMGNCQLCKSAAVLWVQIADANSSTTVPMQATLGMINGSFVFDAIIPYEIKQLENITSPLVVLVSLDGQHFHDSTVRISLKKTMPLRVGIGMNAEIKDFGFSYSCNQARMEIAQRYGRSMETKIFIGLKKTVATLVNVINSSKFDMWFYCSGVWYTQHREVARLLPMTTIVTASGDDDVWSATRTTNAELTANFNTCWGSLDQARYLAGITAGGFALSQGLNRIAYLAALRIPQVILGLNAFALGARSVHPNITIDTMFTGAFNDAYTEKRLAEKFLADGIRILAQHTDSKEPQFAAQRVGGWAVGSNSNIERSLFGDFLLTAPFMVWANTLKPFFERTFNDVHEGMTNICGLGGDCVTLAAFSPLVSDSLQERVRLERARISNSKSEMVFCGEMKDSKGNVRVPLGECMNRTGKAQTTWFLDNVRDLGNYVAPLPAEQRRYIGDVQFGIVCGLVVIMLAISSGLVVFVIYNRNTPVMRAASWKFLVAILFAVILSLCAVPMLGLDESRAPRDQLDLVCGTLPWIIMLSLLFSFGSLFAKTWRLFYLFTSQSKSLTRTTINDTTLFGFLIGTSLPGVILCGVWSGVDPVVWGRLVESKDAFGHSLSSHGHCQTPIVYPAILAGYFILLLLIGNYLAFKTRKLPSAFTEAKWITQVLSSVFQCLVLYIPLDLLIESTSTAALFLLRALSLLLVDGMLVGFIFAPKLFLMNKFNAQQLEEMQSKSVSDYLRETGESGSKTSDVSKVSHDVPSKQSHDKPSPRDAPRKLSHDVPSKHSHDKASPRGEPRKISHDVRQSHPSKKSHEGDDAPSKNSHDVPIKISDDVPVKISDDTRK